MKKTIIILLILSGTGTMISRAADANFDCGRGSDMKVAAALTDIPVPVVSVAAQKNADLADVRGEVPINMNITYPTKRGIAAKDPANGVSVAIELPAIDPDAESLCYNLDGEYNGANVQGTVEFWNINWRDHFNLKVGDIELEMFVNPGVENYSGAITGEARLPGGYEKVSLRIDCPDSYSRVYVVTGKGINLKIQGGAVTGNIRQGAYQDRTVAAILSLALMLRL